MSGRSTLPVICSSRGMTVADQRSAVDFLVAGGLSVQRACAVLQLHRSTFRYAAHPRDDMQTVSHMQRLAAQHPRYG